MYQASISESLGKEIASEDLYSAPVAQCPEQSIITEPGLPEYVSGIFTTQNWPARWNCGFWSQTDGWIHIISDLLVFSAYFSIPILLLIYLRKTPDLKKYSPFFIIFSLFIFACGITHLIEAIIFWQPYYRLNGVMKSITAVVSWMAVFALVKNAPFISWLSSSKNIHSENKEMRRLKREREAFLKHAPYAIAVLDNDMKYILANDVWCRDYHLSESDIIGKSYYEVFPETLKTPRWLEQHQSVLQGNSINVSKDVFITANGDPIYIKYRLQPWKTDQGKIGGMIMYMENITDQVNMQKELEENQKHLQEIFDHSPLGICMVDETGQPFIANDRMCEIVGYSREALTSMTFDKFTHPEDVDKDVSLFEQLKRNEISHYCIDKKYVSAEGKISHVVLNVSMVAETQTNSRHALAIIQDITPRIEATERSQAIDKMLNELNSLMKETWQIAQMGSWEFDINTETFEWGETVHDIFGMNISKKLPLSKLKEVINRQDLKNVEEAINLGISQGKSWDMDIRVKIKGREEIWLRFIGHPVVEESKVVKIEGLIKDIDQIKKYNIELTELNAKLEHLVDERTAELAAANKELEAFAYSVSHDLRAPLRAIDGFASALEEDYSEIMDKSARHYLGRIEHNTRKMGQLIDDLLNFSRSSRSEARFQQFLLKDRIQGLINDMMLPEKYEIEMINLNEIYGDKTLLMQVFQNLIDNAVKYSSKEENPKITIEQIKETDGQHFIISDNGVGFDNQYAHQIFTIFQRLHSDREFEGTGIGLALCKKILDRHSGKIWAESEKGTGSSFHVFLPHEQNSNHTLNKHDKKTIESDNG